MAFSGRTPLVSLTKFKSARGFSMRSWCCIFATLLALLSPALAEPNDSPRLGERAKASTQRADGRYYVEFRVATIGTYGHSYIVYGHLNAAGNPKDFAYADLHPVGNYALM